MNFARVIDWAHKPQDIRRFAVARIGLGLTMLAAYLHIADDLALIYGEFGIIAELRRGPLRFVEVCTGIAWLTAIGSAISYTLGHFTRFSACLLVLTHASFMAMTRVHTWGWTTITPAFVLYIAFAGAGRIAGLDGRRSNSHWSPSSIPWRLIQTHCACVYFTAGWSRLFSPGWHRGDMVLVALENTEFSRFSGVDWFPLAGPLALLCWAAWALELAAPLALLHRKTAVPCAIGLILMHLSLEALTTVAWWQYTMTAVLTTFLPLSWHLKLGAAVRARFARLQTSPGGRTQ